MGFRVNAFRHKVALDYNPTVPSIVQLVRLLQAECEASALGSMEGSAPDKKARAAAARTEALPDSVVLRFILLVSPKNSPRPQALRPLRDRIRVLRVRVRGKVRGRRRSWVPVITLRRGKDVNSGIPVGSSTTGLQRGSSVGAWHAGKTDTSALNAF